MKIRLGFVSNSSSSSYTCCFCGEEVSGMDMCLSEAGMSECKNGHYVCDDHLLEEISTQVKIDFRDETPSEMCPICQFQILLPEDGFKYLLMQQKLTEKDLTETIKEKYNNYKEFKEEIK